MAENNFVSVGAAATADLLSFLSLPGGNTMQRLVDAHLEKRRAIAREALITELKGGFHGFTELGMEDLDPLIGILMRFWRAAEEGLAKDNLRLLAQIIAGLKKHRSLNYDNFARWSSVLESLTRDELLIIGAAFTFDGTVGEPLGDDERRFWGPFREHMASRGFSPEELEVHCAAIARHGLFRAASGWGALVYDVTPRLRELGTLADVAS